MKESAASRAQLALALKHIFDMYLLCNEQNEIRSFTCLSKLNTRRDKNDARAHHSSRLNSAQCAGEQILSWQRVFVQAACHV